MNLPLTIVKQSTLAVTVSWTPPAGVVGYLFSRDGQRVSSTFDATKKQVTFGIPDDHPHTFAVTALGGLAAGQVIVNGPTPPSTVSNSLKTGDKLLGTYQWKVETAGDCVKVEFWSDKTKLGEVAGASPYVFAFDTSKVAAGDHLFGIVEVDSAGVRHPDENRVTAHVGTVAPPPTPTSTPTWDGVINDNAVEYTGVHIGAPNNPPVSARLTVGAEIDGIKPPPGCPTLTRFQVLSGDQYLGTTGWRTLARTALPDGTITMYTGGHDSSFVWAVWIPPGFPADANMWVAGFEVHQTKASYVSVTGVAPGHMIAGANAFSFEAYGGRDGARVLGVSQSVLPGYSKGAWHIFAHRWKHSVNADGAVELWHAEAGKGQKMQQLISKSGIKTQYEGTTNYFEWGLYRSQSGSSTTKLYMAGGTKPGSIALEFASITDAVAWGNNLAA